MKAKNLNHTNFFPYESYRPEQKEIIREIEIDSRLRKNMLLVAPSGTGKTIIALSALLPLAYEKDLKIIYMCRTHTQSSRIIKELKKISRYFPEMNLIGLSLRGRKEMCVNPAITKLKVTPINAMLICSSFRENQTCNYYNNFKNKTSSDIILKNFDKLLDAQDIFNYCHEKDYCPYYFSRVLLHKAKVVVCNFQWMINSEIRSQILSLLGVSLNQCILIIDECHNLLDMSIMANSSKLSLSFVNTCLREIKSNEGLEEYLIKYREFLEFLKQDLKEKRKQFCLGTHEIDAISFLNKLYKILGFSDSRELRRFLQALELPEFNRFLILRKFWEDWITNSRSEKYFFHYNIKKRKTRSLISFEIDALEPREAILPLFIQNYACLNLSGTVNPYVYRNLSGINKKETGYKEIIANSPFERKNIKALIVEGVSTKMICRKAPMYQKLIKKIKEVIKNTPANVGVFCASYEILEAIRYNGIKEVAENCGKTLFVEEVGMTASENAKMLNEYKILAKPESGAVLLGVCGGRNSEGEDYPGDFMNAVIIVGIPYHVVSPRVNAKIEYFDKMFKNQGWLFGYLYPAMQRANEASGRPIRKEGDKGVIVYLDSRFKGQKKWIADWIRKEVEIVPDRENFIHQKLKNFWK